MKDYVGDLHKCIIDLFGHGEIKFELRRIENVEKMESSTDAIGVRVTHIPSGTMVICEDYEDQVPNANIAMLKLKKILESSAEKKKPTI